VPPTPEQPVCKSAVRCRRAFEVLGRFGVVQGKEEVDGAAGFQPAPHGSTLGRDLGHEAIRRLDRFAIDTLVASAAPEAQRIRAGLQRIEELRGSSGG